MAGSTLSVQSWKEDEGGVSRGPTRPGGPTYVAGGKLLRRLLGDNSTRIARTSSSQRRIAVALTAQSCMGRGPPKCLASLLDAALRTHADNGLDVLLHVRHISRIPEKAICLFVCLLGFWGASTARSICAHNLTRDSKNKSIR